MEQIQPKELPIDGKVYLLGKFPAIAGREIITQYPTSALPKVGDYKTNEDLMLKMMAYVSVVIDGREPLKLSTRELINNHVPSTSTLLRLEWAMMEHNFDFFGNGKASGFLAGLGEKVQQLITKTLTGLLPQSSAGK